MGTFEVFAMSAALGLMFAAVGVKVFTAQLISRMKAQISQVTTGKQEALSRLKGAQGKKAVNEQNKLVLETKKKTLVKKLTRLKKEMGELEGEAKARKQRAEMRKIE